jgi:hypothetical protein
MSAVAVRLDWAHGRTHKRTLLGSVDDGDRVREERLGRHARELGGVGQCG